MNAAQKTISTGPAKARACCRVSRKPVYTSPDWCWQSPAGDYAVRISLIGGRIISLTTAGRVDLDNLRDSRRVISRVLADPSIATRPMVVIDDLARITGATLNARSYLARQLPPGTDLLAYIAYGGSSVFGRELNQAHRMQLFNFPIRVVEEHVAAVRAAQDFIRLPARPRNAAVHGASATGVTTTAPSGAAPPTSSREAPTTDAQGYARGLFEHIGRLSLERDGVDAVPEEIAPDHPFRAVYDALGMIHADMKRILARRQRNLIRLQDQKQALLEKNAALAETQTTLKILLRTRREGRRTLTARIGQRFRDLLPVVEGLKATALTSSQQRQVAFIRDIITHISHTFRFNTRRRDLKLTPRETLTAYLVARGCTTREVAAVLNMSPRTIERYRTGLRRKAGLEGTGRSLGSWLGTRADEGAGSKPCKP
jgi:DNA-binding CsgD family transcriptional regulator